MGRRAREGPSGRTPLRTMPHGRTGQLRSAPPPRTPARPTESAARPEGPSRHPASHAGAEENPMITRRRRPRAQAPATPPFRHVTAQPPGISSRDESRSRSARAAATAAVIASCCRLASYALWRHDLRQYLRLRPTPERWISAPHHTHRSAGSSLVAMAPDRTRPGGAGHSADPLAFFAHPVPQSGCAKNAHHLRPGENPCLSAPARSARSSTRA